jgi:hypothetical protein
VESQQSKICFLEKQNSNFKKRLSTRKTLFTNFVKKSMLLVYTSNKFRTDYVQRRGEKYKQNLKWPEWLLVILLRCNCVCGSTVVPTRKPFCSVELFKPVNAELNLIFHLLALLEAHPVSHVSRISVNTPYPNISFNTRHKMGSHFTHALLQCFFYSSYRCCYTKPSVNFIYWCATIGILYVRNYKIASVLARTAQ